MQKRDNPVSPMEKKLLYFVSEDWYFLSHRLQLAKKAQACGCEVILVARVGDKRGVIEAEGIRVVPLNIQRGKINPFSDILLIWRLFSIVRQERPDIIHNVALKPVLYGSLVGKLLRVKKIINSFGGMGFLYSSRTIKARILAPLASLFIRLVHLGQGIVVIVQNRDDQLWLENSCGISASKLRLVKGSGVDAKTTLALPEPGGEFTVALVGRMLEDKGVREFCEAASIVHQKFSAIRFLLVGDIDPDNPASLGVEELEQLNRQGAVQWMGFCDDIESIWRQSHLSVLPSYREGLPKTLIESSAYGRPAIATNVPGCREIVEPGVNGLLVPARDAEGLAEAIIQLYNNSEQRLKMGLEARRLFEENYTSETVNSAIVNEY